MIGHPPISTLSPGATLFRSNDADSAVQALNVGDKLTDSFTVTTIDGTPQAVTVAINGTNDAAVICGATTGSDPKSVVSGKSVDLGVRRIIETKDANAHGFTA